MRAAYGVIPQPNTAAMCTRVRTHAVYTATSVCRLMRAHFMQDAFTCLVAQLCCAHNVMSGMVMMGSSARHV